MTKRNGYSIQFEVPGKPRTKENKGQFNKKSFYFKMYPEIIEWEQEVHDTAIKAMKDNGWPGPYKGRCIIGAEFCFDSWLRRDITNFWKSLNDALNGAIWVDDSQVDATIQVRHIDRRNPKVKLYIWFIDFEFDEEYGKKKPDTYDALSIVGLSLSSAKGFIKSPEEAAPKRFGSYVKELGGLGTRSKKNGTTPKKKAVPRKVDKRSVTHEQTKVKAELPTNGCKNSSASKRRSTRRSRSSAGAAR